MKYDFYTELFSNRENDFTKSTQEMRPFLRDILINPGSVAIVSKLKYRTDLDDKLIDMSGATENKAIASMPNGYIIFTQTPKVVKQGEKIDTAIMTEMIEFHTPKGLYYVVKDTGQSTFNYGYYDKEAIDMVKSKNNGNDDLANFAKIGIIPDLEGEAVVSDLANTNIIKYINAIRLEINPPQR